MQAAAYLGIDIGTSGIRGCCIDEAGTELVALSIPFEKSALIQEAGQRSAGSCEQDPAPWLDILDQLLSQVSSILKDTCADRRIRSIAIDGTSSTLIACSADGRALSPALMYNDQQSVAQAEAIKQFAPQQSAVHGAGSSLAKAMLLLDRFPDTELFCHQADWLSAHLSGQFGHSDDNNCLKMGYDSIERCWPEWLFENTQITRQMLPEAHLPGSRLTAVRDDLIEKYGLDENCCMVAGTTDSNAAVLATGACEPGDAVTSLGSTLVLKVFSEKPVFAPRYGIYSHRLNGNWLVGGASNSGGKVLLQHFTQQQIDSLSADLKPEQATGLSYYPLPTTGERFPFNDSNKASVIEPRPDSDATFFQALLEGMASIEAEGYKKLSSLGTSEPKRIFTAGGGSKNTGWRRIRERITGTVVVSAAHTEACYGSALLARDGCRK